ncbi:hypothetical protein J2R62_15035 [Plesiomonas shigelloides]|uniref:Uncharacterized protein n=1 Tax=Plesiomonas shigelloides TaxID=703 RepID=A0A8I1W946_PLESH|nr:hypothetical protein [Plesiomonas shigelloides]MBO1109500.1 hypothetical protein [Plesiomonas shigelloides]
MIDTITQGSDEHFPHPNDPVSDEYMELKNEPVLYEWKIEVPMYGAWFMSISSGGVGLLIAGCFALFGEENSFVGSVLFSFLGVSLILFVRYFGHPNEIFHYFITPKGVYYTQQGKVSDNFYLVVNMLGWLLVLVSLVAVAVIGPFALVGAGGGAFMAMGMTKMRAKISHLGAYFTNGDGELNIYKRGLGIEVNSRPGGKWSYVVFHCLSDNFDQIYKYVKSRVPDYEEKEVLTRKEFGY